MIASTFQALIVPSAALPGQVATANTLNDQGVQLWQRGRRSEAVAAFNEAARADGGFAVPWHNLGAVYLIEGQFTQAVSALERAVRLAPRWTLPRTHLARAYLRAGNAVAALQTSDAARALDPTLPDIRDELRTILRARLQIATALTARRRTFFIFSLATAALFTVLTAGIGFATLAVPIYRFLLFAQARRERESAQRQLAQISTAPAAQPAVPAPSPGTPLPGGALPESGAYVVAGSLPPVTPAELDTRAPSGTVYRRAGWWLLVVSILSLGGGVYGLILASAPARTPQQQDLNLLLEVSVLPFLVVAGLCCVAAVLIGAVAAFRRHRLVWAIAILVIGGLGTFVIVPAQLMVLLYLVAMPHKPAGRGIEYVPTPEVALGNGRS